jgi:hypothetical protein
MFRSPLCRFTAYALRPVGKKLAAAVAENWARWVEECQNNRRTIPRPALPCASHNTDRSK